MIHLYDPPVRVFTRCNGYNDRCNFYKGVL